MSATTQYIEMTNRAFAHWDTGELAEARSLFENALRVIRASDDPMMRVHLFGQLTLGDLCAQLGDVAAAEVYFVDASTRNRRRSATPSPTSSSPASAPR